MTTGRTESGLQYAVRKSGTSVGYCALGIKCGTRDEAPSWSSGIAHFTEHTIFKGTERKSAGTINSYLDALGGELNAYTTKEEIVLHATVLREDLSKAASLLFELAVCPTFPEGEIAVERGVVIDEIHSYKDAPSEEIYDRFEERLFEGSPLSRPILGTAASVRKISRNELLQFVREKFIPSKMVFTVVSPEEERKVERMIKSLSAKFFPQKGQGDAAERKKDSADGQQTVSQGIPTFKASQFDISVNKRNHQANCIVGGTAPSLYRKQERIATILLCNILGGPATNSILNSVLREKNGWVYAAECTYTQYADSGIVAIYIGCDRSNMEKCLKAVDRELAKLRDTLMSDRKLKAAKKQLLGQLAVSSDNGETQCLSMCKGLLSYGRVASDQESRELVMGVSAEQLRDAARDIFAPEKICRLVWL